jgi:mxaD protein
MRVRIHAIAALALLSIVPMVMAANIKVVKSVEVPADAVKTWATVGDFGGAHGWHPAVETTKITKGTGKRKGDMRVLTLKGGGDITETLTSYSARKHSFSYRIDDGPLPVKNYNATISIEPGQSAGKSRIVWRASFDARDGSKDDDVRKMIEDIFDAGLGNASKMLGS